MLDTTPNMPVYKAWNIRQRDEGKDIGPAFKYGSKTQLNWISDSLKRNTLSNFKDKDVISESLNEQLQSVILSGRAKTFVHKNLINHKRTSQLGYNHPVTKGDHFLKDLHNKTFFKACTSLNQGVTQEKSLKIGPKELTSKFADISRKIKENSRDGKRNNIVA